MAKKPETNRIICGSAKEVLQTMPAESINCCISSPPYWSLRDYGVAGQLGLEKTFEEYIDKLCGIYDEVKRVLRPDGTCFVNLGTCFNDKCDQAIPERFVVEMINRGWIKRRTIIWHKPNPMPSSVKDDFTTDFEYVYFFVKQRSYFFEPIYEPYLTESNAERPRMGQGNQTKYMQKRAQKMGGAGSSWQGHSGTLKADGTQIQTNPLGRNKRTVWEIPTQAYPDAHFATFPEKLVEPMILAGCPKEVCTKCGKGRRKVYDVSYELAGGKGNEKYDTDNQSGGLESGACKPQSMKYGRANAQHHFKGYTDCGCGAEWRPGIVLDPFWGRARLARSLPNTDATGSELNSSRSTSKWRTAA